MCWKSWWHSVGCYHSFFQLSSLVWTPSQVGGGFTHLFWAHCVTRSFNSICSPRLQLVTISYFIGFSSLISSQNWIISNLSKWSNIRDFLWTTYIVWLNIRRVEHISLISWLVTSSQAFCCRFTLLFYTLRNVFVPLQCVISFGFNVRLVVTILITKGISNSAFWFYVLWSQRVQASHGNGALRPSYLLFAHQSFSISRLIWVPAAARDGSISLSTDVKIVCFCLLRAWNTVVEEGAILALSTATVLSVGIDYLGGLVALCCPLRAASSRR